MNQTAIDPDELKRYSFNVWSYKQGEMVSLMVHLGDRLGLYKALDGAGPVTPSELAEQTGLQERWLLEWLRGQAAARLLDYVVPEDGEPDRFELTPVGAAVLADEEGSLAFAAGAFTGATPPETVDKLVDAFKTGVGLSYQDLGPNAAHRTERMLGPWVRQALVPEILPALDGVSAKLESGARVADVGCGGGLALAAMAQAFPNAEFHGYDPSSHATDRCDDKARELGLNNLKTFTPSGEALPDEPTYDLIITFDCIHDMTHPTATISAIRRSLDADGTWFVADVHGGESFEKNLEEQPFAGMFYGFSVICCMRSALATPDGEGLGTLGFHEGVAHRMSAEAGCTRFVKHDFDNPVNDYYEIRP